VNPALFLSSRGGVLIHPHDVTTYCADKKDPWHYMWLEVDGLIAARIFAECHLSRQSPIYRPNLNKDNVSASATCGKLSNMAMNTG
jgi:hypothetical protein